MEVNWIVIIRLEFGRKWHAQISFVKSANEMWKVCANLVSLQHKRCVIFNCIVPWQLCSFKKKLQHCIAVTLQFAKMSTSSAVCLANDYRNRALANDCIMPPTKIRFLIGRKEVVLWHSLFLLYSDHAIGDVNDDIVTSYMQAKFPIIFKSPTD